MPNPSLMRRLFMPANAYLFNDDFSDDRAILVVDFTPATPGPGVRTVVDTESKLSLSGGAATFAGSITVPVYGDPGLWLPAVKRVTGRMLLASYVRTSGDKFMMGFGATQSTTLTTGNGFIFAWGVVYHYGGSAQGPALFNDATSTTYSISVVLRASGAFLFVKGGIFTVWTLLTATSNGATATLYPAITNYNMVFTVPFLRVPSRLWLPVPLASDAFTGTRTGLGSTDGLGHAEVNGGGGLAWQHDVGIWALSGAAAVGTPTLGPELDSGNLVVGNWYSITVTQVDYFYADCAIGSTFRAAATTALDANNKVKLITLSTTIAVVPTGSADVLSEAAVTMTAGTRAGLCLRCDSQSSPANFLLAYHDGTNVKLDKCVAGVYTNLISVAAVYGAGYLLRVITDGSAVRVYYNNVFIGTEQTVSDAGILSNTLHGLFSTYSSNSLDNFVCWERKGAQYQILDTL